MRGHSFVEIVRNGIPLIGWISRGLEFEDHRPGWQLWSLQDTMNTVVSMVMPSFIVFGVARTMRKQAQLSDALLALMRLQRDAQRVDQEVQICSAEFQGGGERLHDISPPDAATSFLDTSITRAACAEIEQEPVVLGQALSET